MIKDECVEMNQLFQQDVLLPIESDRLLFQVPPNRLFLHYFGPVLRERRRWLRVVLILHKLQSFLGLLKFDCWLPCNVIGDLFEQADRLYLRNRVAVRLQVLDCLCKIRFKHFSEFQVLYDIVILTAFYASCRCFDLLLRRFAG